MRAYQVFAWIDPDQMAALLGEVSEKAPGAYARALATAAAAMRARPNYLLKQPPEKRAQAVRRALSRVVASEMAEELLASYFLDCRKELLTEWLDALGLEHEDGLLKQDEPPCPPEEKLQDAVSTFRQGASAPDRELLLRAFAAQSAVDWPTLEALLAES